MSNVSQDNLRYLSQSAPLEKQITFNDLQNRPTGFQTAIPRNPIAEQMGSMEFKNMEGMMYEAAASSSKQVRQEQMREAMVDEAAAIHGVPHQYMQAVTYPTGQGLPQEQSMFLASPVYGASESPGTFLRPSMNSSGTFIS